MFEALCTACDRRQYGCHDRVTARPGRRIVAVLTMLGDDRFRILPTGQQEAVHARRNVADDLGDLVIRDRPGPAGTRL